MAHDPVDVLFQPPPPDILEGFLRRSSNRFLAVIGPALSIGFRLLVIDLQPPIAAVVPILIISDIIVIPGIGSVVRMVIPPIVIIVVVIGIVETPVVAPIGTGIGTGPGLLALGLEKIRPGLIP